MEVNYAQQLASKFIGLETTKTLCVTSDGGVFINNEIEFMKAYAKERNLKIFVFKDDKEEVAKEQEVIEPVKEDKPKKEKKK